MRFVALAVLPLIAAALPAQAQENPAAPNLITQGSYEAAEARLMRELRVHPDRPELLLNLAAVYARTGRADAARSLYTRVLSQDDVLMDLTSDRTAGSHMIASAGLTRLQPVQFTAR
ncbi:tetratricopeptide repeat protein [Sphingomonas xinjiangensis]|uniref:Tetratricopeptide (TPR) repeat protein n=1 Tax=Sphingomonas xinjiangensis TaxID=643568 RepID=A0A840YKB3_9SPHN|nr:tetratricopeptide repeat protein [Sphingomonas xinjiangensis]MBB5709546.1 tetratricopeptide (TPR) repeat protein [Sphingomonas xinjiangensis]